MISEKSLAQRWREDPDWTAADELADTPAGQRHKMQVGKTTYHKEINEGRYPEPFPIAEGRVTRCLVGWAKMWLRDRQREAGLL